MKNRYKKEVYSTYTTTSDVVILGASRASHHYIPQVIQDSLHLSVVNFGIDGHNIYSQYIILKSLVEHSKQKPKVVVFDANSIDIYNTPKWNTEKLTVFYPYCNSEEYVGVLLKDLLTPAEYWSLKLFGLYRHNSNQLRYIYSIIKGFPVVTDGYLPLYNKWNQPIESAGQSNMEISAKKVEYFNKFIAICKQENIRLIIAVSPNYKYLLEQKWVEKIRQITNKEDIPFLYHENDSLFLSHREWFNEPFHLNDEGAHIYSRIISEEISEILSVDDNKY